jgi:hypothetical protein
VDEMLKDMKGQVEFEELDSPWSSPIMLIRKNNRYLQFCMDYGWLNNVTKKDCFHLLRMDDTLGTLSGAK